MTSPFFQQSDYRNEQLVIEDLIEEAISIHGSDLLYLPRRKYSVDAVLSEDAQFYYDKAYAFDGYVKNVDKFGGDGTMLTQMGIEIRDRIELTISRRHWSQRVGDAEVLERPEEGDLIYFKLNKRMFEIRYVERFEMDYPLGALPVWDVTCELAEASSLRFSTGIAEIDAFETETSQDLLRFSVRAANSAPLRTAEGYYWIVDSRDDAVVDPLDEAEAINQSADAVLDFSEVDIFADDAF